MLSALWKVVGTWPLHLLELALFLFKVLLSQCHRFRALVLLGRFLDMGPWAVDLVISHVSFKPFALLAVAVIFL